MYIYNSVRVSNELGAGHPKTTSFSVVVMTSTSFIVALICGIILFIARDNISYILTDGEIVAKAVSDLTPLLVLSVILEGIQPVLSGKNSVFPISYIK